MKRYALAAMALAGITFASTADAAEWKYEMKATLDFSNADRTIVRRAGLGPQTDVYVFYYFDNPQDVNSLPAAATYIPADGEIQMDGNSDQIHSGDHIRVTDSQNPGSYGDGVFWGLNNDSMAALGFPEIWQLDLRTRFDPATFSTIDLPTDDSFMSALQSTKVEMLVRRNGPGTGVDFVVGDLTNVSVSVSHSP